MNSIINYLVDAIPEAIGGIVTAILIGVFVGWRGWLNKKRIKSDLAKESVIENRILSVSESLEIMDNLKQNLSNLGYELSRLIRPYEKDNSLTIKTLYSIWVEESQSKCSYDEFQQILSRLQRQGRLPGIVRQGDRIFVEEEHYAWKTTIAREEKQKIAKKAVSFIESDNIVVIDSGSTTIEIAEEIGNGIRFNSWKSLTIITNFFKVADIILTVANEMGLDDHTTQLKVYLTGGRVRLNTLAIVNDVSSGKMDIESDFDSLLRNHDGADIAFVGTNGIHKECGFTTATISETLTKKSMLKWARKRFIVADPSKFTLRQENTFASFEEDISIITTRDGANDRVLQDYADFLKNSRTKIVYA